MERKILLVKTLRKHWEVKGVEANDNTLFNAKNLVNSWEQNLPRELGEIMDYLLEAQEQRAWHYQDEEVNQHKEDTIRRQKEVILSQEEKITQLRMIISTLADHVPTRTLIDALLGQLPH